MKGSLPERIFICGFMGAGKSTVGRALADKLDTPFHDLDACIERRAGQAIRDIFEAEGEPGFRQRERRAILKIIRENKGIIALGGGSLHNQHLLDHIKVNGLLAFMDTPMAVILERIMENRDRPLLLDDAGELKSKTRLESELKALLAERRPLYEQAEVTLQPVDEASKEDLAEQLFDKIRYHVALY